MKHKRYGRNIVDLGQTLKVQVGKSFVDAVGIADTNCKGIHGHGLVEGLHIFGTNQEGLIVIVADVILHTQDTAQFGLHTCTGGPGQL